MNHGIFLLVVGFNNVEEIFDAMKSKAVSGSLIDIYAAATKKHLLEGGDIQMNRIVEYPTGYGIVLSGDMVKSGPLFHQTITKKKAEISHIVEESTNTIPQVSELLIKKTSSPKTNLA